MVVSYLYDNRSQIAGTIKTVKPGATTTHVTIEVSPTVTITASITDEASEEPGLKPGMQAMWASDQTAAGVTPNCRNAARNDVALADRSGIKRLAI